MTCIVDKIKLSETQDRRRKLTNKQKKEIKDLYGTGKFSLNQLSRQYEVSKKSILLIVNPESKAKNDKYIKEHWQDFKQTTEEHTNAVRKTREYKKELLLKGELKKGE